MVEVDESSLLEELKDTNLSPVAARIKEEGLATENIRLQENISAIAEYLYGAFTAIPGPQEVSIEFGVQVTLKSGNLVAMLVDGGANVHVSVKATWRIP